MRNLLRLPFIALPMKFAARIAMAGLWGIWLSPFDADVKYVFGAILGGVASLLSVSFFGFDRVALSPARIALYGLLTGGESMAVGAMVLAALGAFTGQLHTWPMICCAFAGTVLPMYAMAILYRDNTSKPAGSNR